MQEPLRPRGDFHEANPPAEPASVESPSTQSPARTEMPLILSGEPVPSALPSRLARAVALVSIIVAGLCGGLIGYAFADTQCTDNCTTWQGIGVLSGALLSAAGVSIVAVLTLRAMDEWETIKKRDTL